MPSFNIETLSLTTALVIAVIVLWRKLDQKDAMLLDVVKSLERFADVFEALAKALERRRESKRPTRRSTEP